MPKEKAFAKAVLICYGPIFLAAIITAAGYGINAWIHAKCAETIAVILIRGGLSLALLWILMAGACIVRSECPKLRPTKNFEFGWIIAAIVVTDVATAHDIPYMVVFTAILVTIYRLRDRLPEVTRLHCNIIHYKRQQFKENLPTITAILSGRLPDKVALQKMLTHYDATMGVTNMLVLGSGFFSATMLMGRSIGFLLCFMALIYSTVALTITADAIRLDALGAFEPKTCEEVHAYDQ